MTTLTRQAAKIVAVSIAVTVITLDARQADRISALRTQIDRIFKSREYNPPRFGPARWLPDATAYAIVEPASGGAGSEIVRGGKIGLDIDDYDMAPGGRMAFHTYSQFDRPPVIDVVGASRTPLLAGADGSQPASGEARGRHHLAGGVLHR
jgi:hypothetical protein